MCTTKLFLFSVGCLCGHMTIQSLKATKQIQQPLTKSWEKLQMLAVRPSTESAAILLFSSGPTFCFFTKVDTCGKPEYQDMMQYSQWIISRILVEFPLKLHCIFRGKLLFSSCFNSIWTRKHFRGISGGKEQIPSPNAEQGYCLRDAPSHQIHLA